MNERPVPNPFRNLSSGEMLLVDDAYKHEDTIVLECFKRLSQSREPNHLNAARQERDRQLKQPIAKCGINAG